MTVIKESPLVAWSSNVNLQYEKMQLSDLQRNEESRKKRKQVYQIKVRKERNTAFRHRKEKMEPIEAEFTRYQCALEKYIGGSS